MASSVAAWSRWRGLTISLEGGLLELVEFFERRSICRFSARRPLSISKSLQIVGSLPELKTCSASCLFMAEFLPEIFHQRKSPDGLDRAVAPVSHVIFASAGSHPKIDPVRGLVTGSGETLGVNECLKAIERMVIELLPVIGDASTNQAKNVGCEMRNTDPGQNEESRIIGQQVDVAATGMLVPSDETVAAANMTWCRTERYAGDRSVCAIDNVFEVLAYRLSIAKIVIAVDQVFVERFGLGAANLNC